MIASTVEIPNRSLFRQPEVCEIAQVQPYVLRSWEAEFPDLGVSKSANGPRVYRRADVERVLRLKHLLFVEGLTLAGARRKLEAEQGTVSEVSPELDALIGSDMRERLMLVKRGLRELQVMLGEKPGVAPRPEAFVLREPKPRGAQKKPATKKPTKKRAS